MKKIIATLLISFGVAAVAMAQDDFSAARYGGQDINGTARYMSMAGAFGALGGDASSIGLNPAGLGVYRKSELSLSLGGNIDFTQSTWGGQTTMDSNPYFTPNNLAFVLSFANRSKTSGFIGSNFAFTYNRLKNYNRNTSIRHNNLDGSLLDFMVQEANGWTASELTEGGPDLPTLGSWTDIIYTENAGDANWIPFSREKPEAEYVLNERGSLDEWSFSYGANFGHKVYFGISVGIQSLSYTAESRYTEDFSNGGFDLYNYSQTKGAGANAKIGVIYKPINALRLGLALHSPTLFGLTHYYNGEIESGYVEYDPVEDEEINYGADAYLPEDGGDYMTTYRLLGAWQGNVSAAVLLGQRGLISLDYGLTEFTSSRMWDKGYNGLTPANDAVGKNLQPVHSLRIGAEVNITNRFALRTGYSFVTSPFKKNADIQMLWDDDASPEYFINNSSNNPLNISTHNFAVGFGFKTNRWFFDFAYLLKYQNQDFVPFDYQGIETARISNYTNNLVATVGFRF